MNQISEYPNWDAKFSACIDAILKAMPALELTRNTVHTALSAMYETFNAVLAYEARTMFHGKIVLVRASNQLGYFQTTNFPYDYGVSELCDGGVEVKVIEGDHLSFIVGPGAKLCADIISKQLK
ncbi:fatty acid synthase-like [Haemaphysalis longicornis]